MLLKWTNIAMPNTNNNIGMFTVNQINPNMESIFQMLSYLNVFSAIRSVS